MKIDKLLSLKALVENLRLLIEEELRCAEPVHSERDSKGFVKPPRPYTRCEAVEDIIWETWDQIPQEFTVEQLRTKIGEKSQARNIARRSHAAFSLVLSRWTANRYLDVKPGAGPKPHIYQKRKTGEVVPENKLQ
jgi:hypothetical protein